MANHMQIFPNSYQRRSGFSLIELMVVLAVLGIVAALAAPALMSMAPNMALKSAGRDLYTFLQSAKVLAIRNNTTVTVRFDSPGFYYRDDNGIDGDADGSNYDPGEPRVILGEDLNGNGTLDADEDLDGNVRLDDNYGVAFGLAAAAANFGAQSASVTFNSQGIPTAAATVYLDKSNSVRAADAGYNNDCYAVEVTGAGSLKLHRAVGANWDP